MQLYKLCTFLASVITATSLQSSLSRYTRQDCQNSVPLITNITLDIKTEDIAIHILGRVEPAYEVKQLLPAKHQASHHRGPRPRYELLQNMCSSCISRNPNVTILHMKAVRTRRNATWPAVAIRIFWELIGCGQVEYTGSYHTHNNRPSLHLADSQGRQVPQKIIEPPTTEIENFPTNSSATGMTPSSLMMITLSISIIGFI